MDHRFCLKSSRWAFMFSIQITLPMDFCCQLSTWLLMIPTLQQSTFALNTVGFHSTFRRPYSSLGALPSYVRHDVRTSKLQSTTNSFSHILVPFRHMWDALWELQNSKICFTSICYKVDSLGIWFCKLQYLAISLTQYQYLHNIWPTFAQLLPNIYPKLLQCLSNICTIFAQYKYFLALLDTFEDVWRLMKTFVYF